MRLDGSLDPLKGRGEAERAVEVTRGEFELDLATGFSARGADVSVEIAEPIGRRLTRNDAYDLGGVPHVLSTVWIPCRRASTSVGGNPIGGELEFAEDDPYSSAAIAEAEVWCSLG